MRVYNPQLKKLDERTISGFFIGYVVNSKGFRFYCPSHSPKIVEARNAKFLEEHEVSVSGSTQVVELKEIREPLMVPLYTENLNANQLNSHELLEEQQVEEPPPLDVPHEEQPTLPEPIVERAPEQMEVRKSSRVRKPAISSDYVVYLQESDYDIGLKDDPCSFSQAMSGENSTLWYDAMKEEMESMAKNKVWNLVELPKGVSTIGSKWLYKTKRDSSGNVERHKARLVAKGFTQKEGIDYHETFSPVSKKDSLRIIMALVAHFDLELHQMDVKTAFLNGDLEEEVYMRQPEGFCDKD